MKKVILASVIAAGLATASSPANAKIVFDPAAFAQHAVQYIQTAAQWIKELAWYKQQYEMTTNVWNNLNNITDLRSASNAIGGLTRNYYPEASAIPDLMSDAASLWGRGGEWYSNDLYYASSLADKWSVEMDRRMVVTSNTKAMIEQSGKNAEEHLTRLEYLRGQLQAAPTITDVEAIRGLISLEQQNLLIHQAQADHVNVLLQAERQVAEMRQEQMNRESAEILWYATSPVRDTLR